MSLAAVDVQDQPTPTARMVWSAVLIAICQAIVVADLWLFGLCVQRWLAPFSSFDELAAVISTAGLSAVAPIVVRLFQNPFELWKSVLRGRGYDVDTWTARMKRVPEVPIGWMIVLLPLMGALGFAYQTLRPVRITIQNGQESQPCFSEYFFQGYLGEGTHRTQGPDSLSCDAAFSRTYQEVRIRTGIWRRNGEGQLSISVGPALISNLVLTGNPKAASVVSDGGFSIKPAARPDVTIRIRDALSDSASAFACRFTIEAARPGPTTVRAELKAGGTTLGDDSAWAQIP